MTRKWIYLYEDETIKTDDINDQTGVDATRKQLTDRSEELKRERKTLGGQLKTNLTNTKDNVKNQMKLKQHEKSINAKNKNPQVQSAVANGTTSASVLDEENDDALPIDTKGKDPEDVKEKELTHDAIKNEKDKEQPLKEFMDFYKFFNK